MNQQYQRSELARKFEELRHGIDTPDSLGRAIISFALREAPTKGNFNADGDTVDLPLTVRIHNPPAETPTARAGCVSICAYGPGGVEIGCVWICVQ